MENLGRKRSRQLNAAVANLSLVSEIGTRAKSLDLSQSKFVALILEDWFRRGCPAISAADAALLFQTNRQHAKRKAQESHTLQRATA